MHVNPWRAALETRWWLQQSRASNTAIGTLLIAAIALNLEIYCSICFSWQVKGSMAISYMKIGQLLYGYEDTRPISYGIGTRL
jgi:hypothetical protein